MVHPSCEGAVRFTAIQTGYFTTHYITKNLSYKFGSDGDK